MSSLSATYGGITSELKHGNALDKVVEEYELTDIANVVYAWGVANITSK